VLLVSLPTESTVRELSYTHAREVVSATNNLLSGLRPFQSLTMLRALYYPFSRCIDPAALKQLLLVFDSITFLDPVDDDEWRAKLFRDLEHAEDRRFQSYRELEHPLSVLRSEGVVEFRAPHDCRAFNDPTTVASTVSDLLDSEWRAVAAQPETFGLPCRRLHNQGRATWQIFPDKLPGQLRDLLHDEPVLREHLLWSERQDSSWTVTYEAGSAATMNLHLAAAGELGLAPVTDSVLHHRLLLHKLARLVKQQPKLGIPESGPLVEALSQQTACRLIGSLLPRSSLATASFDEVLAFRDRTQDARRSLVDDLSRRFALLANSDDPIAALMKQRDVEATIQKELREYQASLAAARAKVWPNIVGSLSAGVPTGAATTVGFQWLVGGSAGLVAGSIAAAAVALLKSTLEYRAELTRTRVGANDAVAYLSHVVAG
jgi:hypothetical protein